MQVIQAVVVRGEMVGKQNAEKPRTDDEFITDKTQDQLAEQVLYASISNMYEKQFKSLEFHVTDSRGKSLVIDCLNQV